jgi:hypothetical protein
MIIQMNATVCADIDHGEDMRGSSLAATREEGAGRERKGSLTRRNKKSRSLAEALVL